MPQVPLARKELSDCGMADLLAAIFREDRDLVRIKLGIPPSRPHSFCLNCGCLYPAREGYKGCCSRECFSAYSQIPVCCSECGKILYRYRREVIWRTNSRRKQRYWFCNRYCLGKFVGKNYGFRMHPENSGSHRKWDWDKVLELREQTGWGSYRLGRALGIPETAVDYILRRGGKQRSR